MDEARGLDKYSSFTSFSSNQKSLAFSICCQSLRLPNISQPSSAFCHLQGHSLHWLQLHVTQPTLNDLHPQLKSMDLCQGKSKALKRGAVWKFHSKTSSHIRIEFKNCSKAVFQLNLFQPSPIPPKQTFHWFQSHNYTDNETCDSWSHGGSFWRYKQSNRAKVVV